MSITYDYDRYNWEDEPEQEEQELHVPAEVLPTNTEEESELSEVERRLEKAHFYRMLLKHQLISSDSTEAVEVEQEIQDFVRERLAILLGIKSEPMLKMEAMFTPEEVEALRAVAAKVLNKPTIVQVKAEPVKPKPATITPVAEKPAPVRPAGPPPEPTKQPPRRRGRPPKPKAEPKPLQKSEEVQLEPGERIKVVGGKRYKVVDRVVNDPETGQPKLDAKGKKITKEYLVDITPKAEVPGRQPFPSIEVANAMEAAKAQEVLALNPLAAGLVPAAMNLPDTTQKE